MNHLPRIGARAATPCNCPVPTASPVPPGIQFLSTIQPTSHLHLILIQLVFSNESQGIFFKISYSYSFSCLYSFL